MTNQVNRLQLKASLLSAITFHKFGQQLAPNFKTVKSQICASAGQKPNIKNIDFIRLIGLIYKDNNLESEFYNIVCKFKIDKEVYN